MNVERKIIWSVESSKQVESIKSYLFDNWSITKARSFLKILKKEQFVISYPKLYPVSKEKPELRKAIISNINQSFMKLMRK